MASFEIDKSGTNPQVILNDAGLKKPLPVLWLRERAPSADQIDALTQQRFINPHELPIDLQLTHAEETENGLSLGFSDGYQAEYTTSHLSGHLSPPPLLPERIVWKSNLDSVPRMAWADMQDEAGHYVALQAYLQYGFLIITGAPTELETIHDLAGHFGFIRSTNFGTVFEVKTKPNPNDLAYKPIALGPHTDNPYREPTPGIQLLHCIINETSGGLSTLVDSLACVDELRRINPEGLKLLSEIPVRFSFDDPQASIKIDRPIIALDPAGEMLGLHYSPRLDWLPLMDETTTKAYHEARQQLSRLFTHPDYELRFKLEAGECMMFDNNRVLHGRTAFNPNEGHRHLQGCYIDRDGPEILYRRMTRDGVSRKAA